MGAIIAQKSISEALSILSRTQTRQISQPEVDSNCPNVDHKFLLSLHPSLLIFFIQLICDVFPFTNA